MQLILDVSAIDSRQALHRMLKSTLHLPDWYGGNLDALHDCLTDWTQPLELTICGADQLSQTLGSYAATFCQVLTDCAAQNPLLHVVWKSGASSEPALSTNTSIG